ncbi:MAG TPA: twin-arginine translocase TatA/TatE family subunit [Candidatus Dormibacteraeota bacterium]|nr:twin-arginine translocase TatA/TatE family subunit [Candidatus Dormibacteraeota bacterium]
MPGIGHWYVIPILLIIALIVFGPKRLPELGEGLGKAIKEFRKATSDIGNSIREEVHPTEPATGTTYPAIAATAVPATAVPGAPVETPVTPPPAAAVTQPAAAAPPETPRS